MSRLLGDCVDAPIDRSTRVLIVDDEIDGTRILAKLLKMGGYAVAIATDGEKASSHLASFEPDVILLDIAMPGMSGHTLAKHIRSQPECESVAIIALSGYGDEKHKQLSVDAGCDRHLVKPVSLATLEAAIIAEVQKRRHQFSLPSHA